MKRVYLFCTAPLVQRSREHVFPQWLLRELKIADVLVQPTHLKAETFDIVSTRSHTLHEMKEGRVCASCNNGWMSEVEAAAKPLLIRLFRGNQDVRDLNMGQSHLVARWAAKTAYMLNSASNYCMKVPPAHVQYIRNHTRRLPERVLVVGQQHRNTSRFHWGQIPSWGMTSAVDEEQEPAITLMRRSGYKIALQFEQLILMVCRLPVPGWRFLLWRHVHHPLWPLMGPVGWTDSEHAEFPWQDSAAAVTRFALSLEVMSPGRIEGARAETSLKRRFRPLIDVD